MPVSLRLSTLNVSSKDLKVLRSLLGLSGGKSDQSWEIDVDREDGDAVLVDVDNPDGAAIWPEVSQQRRPAAALARFPQPPISAQLQRPAAVLAAPLSP